MKSPLVLLCMLTVLAGCASKAPVALMTHGDPAVDALNESALRIARAAEQAALAESLKNKPTRVTSEYGIDLSAMPNELRDPLLLEGGFHGELEIFLRSLTAAIGWADPVVYGSKPSIPLMVVLTEQRRPPVYWLADAGYQASEGAEVILNVDLRTVVLNYRQPGRGE